MSGSRFLVIPLLLWLPVAATGCFPDRLQADHYDLVRPTVQASTADRDPRTLGVRPLLAPPQLDERFLLHTSETKRTYLETKRWVQRPGALLRSHLVDALERSGLFAAVRRDDSYGESDLILEGQLVEWAAIGSLGGAPIRTRLTLQLELFDREAHKSLWRKRFEESQEDPSATAEGIARTFSDSLQAILDAALKELERLR